ncbi:hypothetical protein DUNSADRAFT_8345 [Dunaliella salina]|uniref:Encoded protein n=1 Tax=Dunaliella salina TaxID=3046 RepID=A0ABQ7GJQ6_DUNSA|nr:hypothetical protein DUNSADRAFT_8345 [Dunaliella salina]|eukprot:KAF5834844.1 hypothetical protein DUNSADRAFT_8345 [Dunaliella salina]
MAGQDKGTWVSKPPTPGASKYPLERESFKNSSFPPCLRLLPHILAFSASAADRTWYRWRSSGLTAFCAGPTEQQP